MPFVTAAVCLLYYLMICRYVGRWNSTFSRFWICCGLVSVCYGIAGGWFPTVMIQALSFAWILFWVVILAVWIRMAVFGHRQAAGNLEYLIVLGAKVDGTRITSSLKLRLDRAYTYATANPSVRIVVSGGQSHGGLSGLKGDETRADFFGGSVLYDRGKSALHSTNAPRISHKARGSGDEQLSHLPSVSAREASGLQKTFFCTCRIRAGVVFQLCSEGSAGSFDASA